MTLCSPGEGGIGENDNKPKAQNGEIKVGKSARVRADRPIPADI